MRCHIFRHHGTGTDDRALTNRNTTKNDGAGTNRGAPAYSRRNNLPVAYRLELSSGCSGPWKTIVYETHVMANEALVLDRHALTNERMRADLAASTDVRVLLNLDKTSNSSVIADGTTVEIDEMKNLNVSPHAHIGSNPL
jgi:hypothetical protein